MPTDREIYEGSYVLDITNRAIYTEYRVWCHTRSGRMELFKNQSDPNVLREKHRPACFLAEGPYYIIKACLIAEGERYIATCGYNNDWLIWQIADGLLIGRAQGQEFYAPSTTGLLTSFGAFTKIELTKPEEKKPFETLIQIIND